MSGVHRVFSYGTLRQPEVQRSLYGRMVPTTEDVLPGYRIDWLKITDADVIATSGSDRHPILRPGGDEDAVAGAWLELSEADTRHEVTLGSGVRAWVYLGE